MAKKHRKICSNSLLMREMQMKATVSWKQEITRAGKAAEEWNSGALQGGRENGAATVENGMQFLKNLNAELPHDQSFQRYPTLPQRLESRDSTLRFMAAIVTTAKGGSNPGIHEGWMGQQEVVYTCNWIWFSLRREGNSDTCYNLNEPWRHYDEWERLDTKDRYLYDST